MEQSVMLMRTYDIVIDGAFSAGVDLYLANCSFSSKTRWGLWMVLSERLV